MRKIYCVEDDSSIRELLEYTLRSSGFDVRGFENASDFMTALSGSLPSLVLLDIMLPDRDGMQVLHELRSRNETKSVPVILLTAKGGRLDKIKGLDGGADDYITKPFDVLELVSRINAVLRRTSAPDANQKASLQYKDVEIDTGSRTVTVAGTPVALTFKEFELLYYLVSNKGIVLSRDKLMNEVWGTDFEGETRTVDVHIRTLRQKLGSAGEYIVTVRNVGYKAAV